jgi:hypothetical protein
MGPQPQQQDARDQVFDTLMDAAQRGEVIVSDVFGAMTQHWITEEQCKQILTAFERARSPKIFASSSSR